MSIYQNPNAIIAKIYQICESLLIPNKDQIALKKIQSDLNEYYSLFMSQVDKNLEYCEPIQKLIDISQLIMHSSDRSHGILWDDNLVNQLDELYNRLYSLHEHYAKITKAERKNSQSLENYLAVLISYCARLLFVRVDLKYHSDTTVGIEQFYQDFSQLRNRITRKIPRFSHLKGCVWAIEQSSKTGGYHCHLLLIYDGNRKNNGWYAARQVGELWSVITETKGCYFNCHDVARIDRFEQLDSLGIGMIYRNDSKQVQNAIEAAKYLTKLDKYDQHPLVKIKGMRTFGHGRAPKPRANWSYR